MKKPTLTINGIHERAVTKKAPKMNWVKTMHTVKTIFVLLLSFGLLTCFSANDKKDKQVLEAFQLRLNGKVDEAKAQLKTILEKEPTNAMAHFELARTLNYIDLRGSEEADKHLVKALEHDPNNIAYAYYNARNSFLKAYIALQTGGDNAKNLITNACNEYLKVLELKADYPIPLMYLVEIYGMLPDELGGDKTKAEEYAKQLEKMNKFYGAKARLVMMPEGTDMIKYWQDYIVTNGEDCKALKELGVAYIFTDNIEGAKEQFEKAIKLDKSQNIRLLDLARFHQMKVMQNRDAAKEELPKAKVYIEQYLESTPMPIVPMKAYAIGMLAKTEMFQGNQEAGKKLMEEAKAVDPYFSRAFGIPSPSIFEEPGKINHHFISFFSPY